MKYGNFTFGQMEALINILGGEENAKKILRGYFAEEIKAFSQRLFDKNGNLIHSASYPRKDFSCCEDSKMKTVADFQIRLDNLEESLGTKVKITAKQFKKETDCLLKKIRENSQIANILNSTYFPIIIPKFKFKDLGVEVKRFLDGVNRSYKKTFPDREFNPYKEENIEKTSSLFQNNFEAVYGHERLVEELRSDFVVGISFPNSLGGLSIKDSRKIVPEIEQFVLSGFDMIIKMIMYPDNFSKEYKFTGLLLPGMRWRSSCPYFKNDRDILYFDASSHSSLKHNGYSAGLFFR